MHFLEAQTIGPRRTFFEVVLAAALICASAARAEEVIYGPDGAPTVVQRKLYTMTGKWEAGVLCEVALNTALVDHLGGVLTVTYHPNEWLDFGVEGLLNHTALSSLARNVRSNLRPRTPSPDHCAAPPYTNCKDELGSDNQLRTGAFGVVRLAPIYGKVDLASELKVHFQAFLLGGAGLASVHRESVNLCADAPVPGPDSSCQHFQQSDAIKPVVDVGGGFRFYFGQRWSLTMEVRGYFFSSSYKEHNDLTVPSTGTPHGYLAGIALFDLGLSFLF
jgi:outer membrane beta-barrel protein